MNEDPDIKAKLNSHVKKRLKTSNSPKKETQDDLQPVPSPKKSSSGGKPKSKKAAKANSHHEEEDSDKEGNSSEATTTRTIGTLDVLHLLLNEKKRSLMCDGEVLDCIRRKQGRLQ